MSTQDNQNSANHPYFYEIPSDVQKQITAHFTSIECWRAFHRDSQGCLQDYMVPQYFMAETDCDPSLGNCALSVWQPLKHAQKCLRQMPCLGDCLLRGEIVSKEHGPVMKGGSRSKDKKHLYWFQYKDIRPETLFSIYEEATADLKNSESKDESNAE